MASKLVLVAVVLFTRVGSSSHCKGGGWGGSEAAEWTRLGEELASAHDRGAAHAVYVRAIRQLPRLLHVQGQDPSAERPRGAAEEDDPKIKGNALLRCAQLAHEVDGDLNESERLYLSAAKILAGSGGLQDTEGDAGETGESIRRHGGVDAVAGYARLMAEYSARRGKAEVLFRRVLKVQPSHSSSLLGLAGLLMDTGNLHELIRAEKLIHQALLLNEMDSEAVAALATLTAKTTGDYDMAEGLYRKALELDPWHLPTMCNYGLLLQGVRRDYDKARGQYQAALAISPGYPPALSFMALMHHTVYDSPLQAHALYTQALARCPTHVPTLVNLGHLTWQALGHTSEAVKLLERAMELQPDDATVLCGYAKLMSALSHSPSDVKANLDQALALYRRALELDPTNMAVMCNHAHLVLVNSGEAGFALADELLSRALHINPGYEDAQRMAMSLASWRAAVQQGRGRAHAALEASQARGPRLRGDAGGQPGQARREMPDQKGRLDENSVRGKVREEMLRRRVKAAACGKDGEKKTQPQLAEKEELAQRMAALLLQEELDEGAAQCARDVGFSKRSKSKEKRRAK